jgi:hypothetical protein
MGDPGGDSNPATSRLQGEVTIPCAPEPKSNGDWLFRDHRSRLSQDLPAHHG